MASCEYGQIAGGTCACSADNPANVESVVIAKCTKDIRGHLRSHDVRDASVHSEPNLLLARAGMYDVDRFNSLSRIGKRCVNVSPAYYISSECWFLPGFRSKNPRINKVFTSLTNPNLGFVSCNFIPRGDFHIIRTPLGIEKAVFVSLRVSTIKKKIRSGSFRGTC